jgi:hypothetical protein
MGEFDLLFFDIYMVCFGSFCLYIHCFGLHVSLAFGCLAHLLDSEDKEDDDDESDARYGRHPAPGDGGHDGPLVELKGGVHHEVSPSKLVFDKES